MTNCPRCDGNRGHALPTGEWEECDFCEGTGLIPDTLPAATDSKGLPFCHSISDLDCYYLHRRCPNNSYCTDNKIIYTKEVQ